ncbi:prohead core protein [Escherichia phage vB_EcoM_EP32a]|uniref:Prohead core protein n=3 Tax=Mosigvirus TaxID=1913652 RepID=A0A0U2D9L2_9CAUD|nr:prohead [Escherichia phage APCEc01]AYR04088.1 prohead core protein [Escherichia phage OLB35]QEG05757.1 prohead core protein [Shigella phage JK36]UOL50702.1 prohead core protein [Escherichia phage vB_EcoM_SCS57]WPK28733.1 prohead core protein [Escherichia phage vB_EcoM_EP32a]AKO61177.1 prohead core protein [Escherichia phage APCEc01]
MDDLIQAIKSNDLVATRKFFESAMAEKTVRLIEARKAEIASQFLIEGEEPEEEEKKAKASEDDADEGDDDEDEDDEDDE